VWPPLNPRRRISARSLACILAQVCKGASHLSHPPLQIDLFRGGWPMLVFGLEPGTDFGGPEAARPIAGLLRRGQTCCTGHARMSCTRRPFAWAKRSAGPVAPLRVRTLAEHGESDSNMMRDEQHRAPVTRTMSTVGLPLTRRQSLFKVVADL